MSNIIQNQLNQVIILKLQNKELDRQNKELDRQNKELDRQNKELDRQENKTVKEHPSDETGIIKYLKDIKLNGKIIHESINNKIKNVLSFATHQKKNTEKIFINNFSNMNLSNIDTFIVILSTQLSYSKKKQFIKTIIIFFENKNKNIIIIEDLDNKYIDFGKHKIGYDYLIENKHRIDHIHLMNDSIIITEPINNIFKMIKNKLRNNSYVGILETTQIDKHYQSWWLILKNNILEYYFNNLTTLEVNQISKKTHFMIHLNEVQLGNKIIKKYNTAACFITPYPKKQLNIFYNNDNLYYKMYENGFKFLKIKRLNTQFTNKKLKSIYFKYI